MVVRLQWRMRNLSSCRAGGDTSRRGSGAGLGQTANPAHAKYKVGWACTLQLTGGCGQGLVSTPGYCKFSAWRRETELPRQPFSRLLLARLAHHSPDRLWLKDQAG